MRLRTTAAAIAVLLASTAISSAQTRNGGSSSGGMLISGSNATSAALGNIVTAVGNLNTARHTLGLGSADSPSFAGETLTGALTYGGVTLSNAVTGTGAMVLGTAPSISSLTVTSAFTATGLVTLADHATQATNTIIGNATSGTASPSALAIGSCPTSGSALLWTTNTGFSCNTAINAATLGGATFAAPGAIGGGTPGAITTTSVSSSGDITATGLLIGNASRLTIGGLALNQQMQLVGVNNGARFAGARFDANASPFIIQYAKSRGSVSTAGALQSGDQIFDIRAIGDDGSTNAQVTIDTANIFATVDGAVSTGIIPSRLEFSTTNSSGARATALKLDSTLAATFSGTLNAQADVQNNGKLLVSHTAPSIASGGCTTGSAQSVSASNGSAAFAITLGGATCGSTIVLTLPTAAAGWVCDAHDITTPASNMIEQTAGGSTTSVTLTKFVRTTGVAGSFTGADVLAVGCSAY